MISRLRFPFVQLLLLPGPAYLFFRVIQGIYWEALPEFMIL